MITGGLLFIAFIIWVFSIARALNAASQCVDKHNEIKCPKDIKFHINRLTAIIYVFLIPVMIMIGFAINTHIPLTIFIIAWILKEFFMNLKHIGNFLKAILLIRPSKK